MKTLRTETVSSAPLAHRASCRHSAALRDRQVRCSLLHLENPDFERCNLCPRPCCAYPIGNDVPRFVMDGLGTGRASSRTRPSMHRESAQVSSGDRSVIHPPVFPRVAHNSRIHFQDARGKREVEVSSTAICRVRIVPKEFLGGTSWAPTVMTATLSFS